MRSSITIRQDAIKHLTTITELEKKLLDRVRGAGLRNSDMQRIMTCSASTIFSNCELLKKLLENNSDPDLQLHRAAVESLGEAVLGLANKEFELSSKLKTNVEISDIYRSYIDFLSIFFYFFVENDVESSEDVLGSAKEEKRNDFLRTFFRKEK